MSRRNEFALFSGNSLFSVTQVRLTSDFQIFVFLVYFIFRSSYDRECVSDTKAIQKGKLMLKALRVQACSMLKQDSDVFLTGIVRASMKKTVSYNVKVSMTETGDIVNTDCECPGGKGPHGTCKHLAAICYMLVQFIEKGSLAVEKSCTESLQTFHHPGKAYKGKAVKMQDLYPSPKLLVEPIPVNEEEAYQDHVRSTVLGYCASGSHDLAFRYLYPCANILHAVKEHSYSKLPFTEHWVDRAIEVSQKKADQIQSGTVMQSECKQWHQEREWRLAASRFGEIIKSTERRDMARLCENLLRPADLRCAPVMHGRTYERQALELFTSMTQIKNEPCGLFINPNYPYLGATSDAAIIPDGLVEVKCVHLTKGHTLPVIQKAYVS